MTQELPWFATVRGRIGYAAGPALFYATAGAAFTEIRTSISERYQASPTAASMSSAGTFSDANTGWVVGGGIEASLGGHWTAKAEYLYMDFAP